jgi:hypothetical protein
MVIICDVNSKMRVRAFVFYLLALEPQVLAGSKQPKADFL